MFCPVVQNAQYTTDPRQQYPAHHKGKSRATDPVIDTKPKGSRDKPRERDKDHGKGKSSMAKSSRSKSGKAQWEEGEQSVQDERFPPFFGNKLHTGRKTANLDHSRQDNTAATDAPGDGSIYDNTYTTAAQPSGDHIPGHEGMSYQMLSYNNRN